MEACGSAHNWARKLQTLGYTVQLIPPQYVKPFVKRNKNDAADAAVICEAMVTEHAGAAGERHRTASDPERASRTTRVCQSQGAHAGPRPHFRRAH
jgi:transposase